MANICTSFSAAFSRRVHRARRSWGIALIAAAIVVAGSGVWSAAPRFYPDDPLWSDDDRAFDASKVGAIEDTNGYDFIVNTFVCTRRASRCARAERQYRRRGARLELVHQPDWPS